MKAPRLDVGPARGERETTGYERIWSQAFHVDDDYARLWTRRVGRANIRIARDGAKVAGGFFWYRMGQWFGGRSVPTWGVAALAVPPERRAGGVATAMMRAALDEASRARVPLSCLYPATQPIYRRAGYDQAGTFTAWTVAASAIGVSDRELPLRSAGALDGRTIRNIYAEAARTSNGFLDRSDLLWDRVLHPIRGRTHAFVAGRAEGYVVYAQEQSEAGRYHLSIRDVVALTPAAGRRILTFLADHRSVADQVKFSVSPSSPLLMLAREQEAKVARTSRWMLRLVDVPLALEARGYPAGLTATAEFEVADDMLPRNAGRFTLEVSAGRGTVRPGGRGLVRADVRGLAPLYTGFASPRELVACGLLEAEDEHLDALAPMFAGPSPFMPEQF